jgi:hypothetical protein
VYGRSPDEVVGLTPAISAVHMDSNDTLQINTLDGNDTVDSAGLPPNLVQLQVLNPQPRT